MLFTIITVTRNNLDGLKRTAQSVKSQSFEGYEWIIIDGASTDGTKELLLSLNALSISEPDNGIYDAMNKGIQRANGFFVIFMNAGDTFTDEHTLLNIASYIEEVQETPDFIYGDALEQISGDKTAYKKARPYSKAKTGMFTHHQAMLYRHDKIDDLRYDTSYSIAADYKFTLQYLENCSTVLYAPFPICLFEQGGVSQQNAKQGRTEQFRIREELNTVSPLQNKITSILQAMNLKFRSACPALYWKLKSKS